MRQVILAVAVVALLVSLSQAEKDMPPSPSELAEIAARGRDISEHDVAAWHASDALMALKPDMKGIERYIARKTAGGWVVAWGGFDEARSKFLIFYEAKQGGNAEEFTIKKHDPPFEDKDFYFRAAKAEEIALKAFLQAKRTRRYNITVLPEKSGNWYVYAIPAQTYIDVLPYGGDIRYTVSSDGGKILDSRQMHKTVIEERLSSTLAFGYHSHVLSDVPEDSDIFYASSRKASMGEWLITANYTYEITPKGSINYVGKTELVASGLEEGKCRAFQASVDLCKPDLKLIRLGVVSLARNQAAGLGSVPLDATPSFTSADCRNGTVFANFDVQFQNLGELPIVLHKGAGTNWVQARFGQTASGVLKGKYEKNLYFTVADADISNPESFIVLKPGDSHTIHPSFPVKDLNPSDNPVMQFLFFSWPPTKDGEAKKYQEQWAATGLLYTEPIVTGTFPAIIDPQLIESCKTK